MELGPIHVLSPPRRGVAGGSMMMLPTPQSIPNLPKSGCGILKVYQVPNQFNEVIVLLELGPCQTYHTIVYLSVICVTFLAVVGVIAWYVKDHLSISWD